MHILLKRPLVESDWTKEDHIQIQAALMGTTVNEVKRELKKIIESFRNIVQAIMNFWNTYLGILRILQFRWDYFVIDFLKRLL